MCVCPGALTPFSHAATKRLDIPASSDVASPVSHVSLFTRAQSSVAYHYSRRVVVLCSCSCYRWKRRDWNYLHTDGKDDSSSDESSIESIENPNEIDSDDEVGPGASSTPA